MFLILIINIKWWEEERGRKREREREREREIDKKIVSIKGSTLSHKSKSYKSSLLNTKNFNAFKSGVLE